MGPKLVSLPTTLTGGRFRFTALPEEGRLNLFRITIDAAGEAVRAERIATNIGLPFTESGAVVAQREGNAIRWSLSWRVGEFSAAKGFPCRTWSTLVLPKN